MLKNTLIILLVVLFGASLAQAQTKGKPAKTTAKKAAKTVWVLQDSDNDKVYPIDKPVPKGNKSYRIVNQTNPNQRISVLRLVRFHKGVGGSPFVFRVNSVYVGMLNKGDGCNVKVLELIDSKTNKRSRPQKQLMFNIILK